MNKNKYFNPGRFAHLFRNDLMINKKTYLFTLIGLFIAIYAVTFLGLRPDRGETFTAANGYVPNLIFYLLGMGAIIGTSFPALTNQIKTGNYLLAPGSTFEKFMVQFFIRIVLFIPVAMILFWIGTHLAKVSLFPVPEIGFDPSSIPDFHFNDIFKNTHLTTLDKFAIMFSIFSAITVLFAGSAYFKRFALVKTLIVSAIIIFVVVCVFVLFSHIFYPTETNGFDIELKTYKITEDLYNVQLAAYILGGLSWLFFLSLAYFKLKEKEV